MTWKVLLTRCGTMGSIPNSNPKVYLERCWDGCRVTWVRDQWQLCCRARTLKLPPSMPQLFLYADDSTLYAPIYLHPRTCNRAGASIRFSDGGGGGGKSKKGGNQNFRRLARKIENYVCLVVFYIKFDGFSGPGSAFKTYSCIAYY